MMEYPRIYVNGLLLHPEYDAAHFGWFHMLILGNLMYMLHSLDIMKHEYIEPQMMCIDDNDYVVIRMICKTDGRWVSMRVKR